MEESVGAFINRGGTRQGGGRPGGFIAQGGTKVSPAQSFGNSRSVYDQVLARAKQLNLPPPTPGYLRLEQSINITTGQIQFQVKENQGTPTSTERRLKLADSFTPVQWAIFLGRVTIAGTVPTATEYAKQIKYTYPEAKVYTKAGESASLMNIYNGFTSLRIGSDIIIDSFPNYKFYRVPESQQGMQYATTAAGVTIQTGGWPNPDWGYLTVIPSFTLMGSQTIELNLNLPASIDMSAAALSFNNMIFEMYGYLTQDGANYNSNAGGKKPRR